MADYIFFLQAERLGDFFLHALRILRGRPHGHLFPLDIGDRDRRLHGGMCQMRREVFRLDDFAAFGEFRVRIADSMHDFPRLARGLLQFFFVIGGVVGGVAAIVPIDFELLAAFECGKRVVGDDRHPAQWLKAMRRLEGIHRNGFLYADHFQSRGVIHRLYLSSQHRRMRNGGVEHAIDPHVHAKQRLARANFCHVETRRRLPNVAPFLRRLKRQLFFLWDGLFGGKRSQFSISELASGILVGDDMHRIGHALRLGNTPLLCGGAHQHQTRGGSGFAQHIEKFADRVRSVGVLRAVFCITVGLQHVHSAPVGVEFVGKNARQAGAHAVSHLRPVGNDVDRSVGVNADENAGMKRGRTDGPGSASGCGP